MSRVYVHSFQSDWGLIRTAATDLGLALIALPGETGDSFDKLVASLAGGEAVQTGGPINLQAEDELRKYLAGHLQVFRVKLDRQGTSFQRLALDAVAEIPYGETRTYGAIAKAIKHPGAARAVGSANARNRLPLIIPCHRVVAATGLGGYAGGLDLKIKLLKLEGSLVR
jgi:methylated-DNA-[protein]-cysteine S-methyltransferase